MSKKYVFTLKEKIGLLKQNAGFSLIEIIVAMGIMSVVAGLFATSVVQLQKSQVSFEDKNSSFAFISALTGSLLGDQQTCTNLLKGQRLSTTPTEFTISNFSGLGSQDVELKKSTLVAGHNDASAKVRINSLTIHQKPNVEATKINAQGLDYERKIAVITVGTEIREAGGKTEQGRSNYVAEAPRTLEVPVYTRGNTIESCQINMTRTDVCNTIGAGVDPTNTSRCLPQEQCFVKGSFFISTCTPSYAGCMPSSRNPVTGSTTCPEKSTRTSTGLYTQTFTVSCGKKCSYNVVNTIEFYMCMQCDQF